MDAEEFRAAGYGTIDDSMLFPFSQILSLFRGHYGLMRLQMIQ